MHATARPRRPPFIVYFIVVLKKFVKMILTFLYFPLGLTFIALSLSLPLSVSLSPSLTHTHAHTLSMKLSIYLSIHLSIYLSFSRTLLFCSLNFHSSHIFYDCEVFVFKFGCMTDNSPDLTWDFTVVGCVEYGP